MTAVTIYLSTYLSHILLHQLWANDANETGVCPVGHCSGTKSFPGSRGTKKKNAFWGLNAETHKFFRLEKNFKKHCNKNTKETQTSISRYENIANLERIVEK